MPGGRIRGHRLEHGAVDADLMATHVGIGGYDVCHGQRIPDDVLRGAEQGIARQDGDAVTPTAGIRRGKSSVITQAVGDVSYLVLPSGYHDVLKAEEVRLGVIE